MSTLADSTISSTDLDGGTSISKPHFQKFQFKVIGKEPTLLTRLSNMATSVDDLDMDDIYEEERASRVTDDIYEEEHGNRVTDGLIATCSRPTLLQTLAGDNADNNGHIGGIPSGSLPPSIQTSSSKNAANIPKIWPNAASSFSGSNFTPGPASQGVAFAASSSSNIQDSERSDRQNWIHPTSSSHLSSPDLVVSSDPDRRPGDNIKIIKKVVALKDKFKAVSSTAIQSQRHAKQALISAQRSAAAAQACLAAAESFVPSVVEVISAVRRVAPNGLPSEWSAVVRDLEDGIYYLKSIGSRDAFDTSRADTLGEHIPHLRNARPPSPLGETRASSNEFLLTRVEEEAQEALRAWNQLDRQIHSVDNGRPSRDPAAGFLPESFHQTQRLGMEGEPKASQNQETEKSGNRVSEEPAEVSMRNLDGNRECHEQEHVWAKRQSAGAGAATQPRREKKLEVAKNSQDGLMQERYSQQPAQTREESLYPSFRGQDIVSVHATANSKASSTKDLSDCQSASGTSSGGQITSNVQSISKPQEGVSIRSSALHSDANSLPPALGASIADNRNEQMPMDMQAEQQPIRPPSLSSPMSDGVFTPRDGNVAPAESTLASHPHLSPPMATICTIPGATSSRSGEKDGAAILPSFSKANSNTSCESRVKMEPVDPMLKLEVEGKILTDESLASNGSAVQVKLDVSTPLKPEAAPECKIGTHSVSSLELPVPLPNLHPALKQKQVEAEISPVVAPVISDSVEVTATPLTSSPNAATNRISSGQPPDPPTPPSPIAPLAPQLIVTVPISQPVHVPVHSPNRTSAIPLALRVERPTRPNHIQDLEESISPDLMSSRGWDADENEGSRRGRRRSSSRFESIPRSRSRDVESNQSVDHSSPSMGLHSESHPALSNLGNQLSAGRRPVSFDEPPTPLIGKKRPRDEARPPGPSRNKRNWRGTGALSENGPAHVTTVSQVEISSNPHSKRVESWAGPFSQPGYNSNNSLQPTGASLMNRLNPSSTPTVQGTNPRFQHSSRPQQPAQNRYRQNTGYDHHPLSFYGHQSYDNRTPQLLSRMTGPEVIQHGHSTYDPGHSQSNIGRPLNQYNRPLGRGRGLTGPGAPQQQNFSKKQPSLLDRLHKP